MENDLLCPMQMRMNEVQVNECPKFMEQALTDTSHTLRAFQDREELCIPFGIRGVASYFPTLKLTTLELATCRRFDLTAEDPEWDPSSTAFQVQEDAQFNSRGMVNDTGDRSKNRRFISSVQASRNHACDFVHGPQSTYSQHINYLNDQDDDRCPQ